jgi:para-aminobenzoate synthetase component I
MLKQLKYNLQSDCSNINIEALNGRFKNVCVLDSNSEYNSESTFHFHKLIALGSVGEFVVRDSYSVFEELQHFNDKRKGWLFGYITYDVKNNIEQLRSENEDGLGFPLLHFFSPEVVLQINENIVSVFYDDDFISEKETETIFKLCFSPRDKKKENNFSEINIQSKITKQEYIDAVNRLKQHMRKGDIYEVNFCQEFFAENTAIDTVEVYEKLNTISRTPFSAYCKFDKRYLLSASPERFLQKKGNKLISQPIKGTIKRSENKMEDDELKQLLKNDAKERSENVMIVDLVRNDLSRIAYRGSVNVDELFGIYSFKQVHQMISTISCELKENCSFTDIIKSTFPMGSMTGAPKVSAMKLIEQYESTKRGLYSGAVGYISPDGDFDFSVVIRSILHNSQNNYTSFMVGSAITDKANAEQEFEECLLKAKAMFEVLEN